MDNVTEQERKKRLAESLLRGERVVVNSGGQIETVEEARNRGDSIINVPEAKLA